MKRIYVFIVLLFATCVVSAQSEQTWVWPIEGAKPGSNIISTPQSFIGTEQNLYSMFIEAPEGSVVVSPIDGTIENVWVEYKLSLISVSSWPCETSFNYLIGEIRKGKDPKYDMKYVCGSLMIKGADGRKISIGGLSSDRIYKTGQKITRGEPIGHVAYSYKPLVVPSIEINIARGKLDDDPMTPFGLQSSFRPYKPVEFRNSFTPAEVKEDFMTFIDAIKECYPGLSDIVSKDELDRYVKTTIATIDRSKENWTYGEVENMMIQTQALIHDTHIEFLGPLWKVPISLPMYSSIDIGWIRDTLVVTNTTKEYSHMFGRPIRSVNGMSADSLKRRQMARVDRYDGRVQA